MNSFNIPYKFYQDHKIYVCLHKECDIRFNSTSISFFKSELALINHSKEKHNNQLFKKVRRSQDNQMHICLHSNCKKFTIMKIYTAYASLAKHIVNDHNKEFGPGSDISSICKGFAEEIKCKYEISCKFKTFSYDKALSHLEKHNINNSQIQKDEKLFKEYFNIKEKIEFDYTKIEKNKILKKGRPRKTPEERKKSIFGNIEILNNILCLSLKILESLQINLCYRKPNENLLVINDVENFENIKNDDKWKLIFENLKYFILWNNNEELMFSNNIVSIIMQGNYLYKKDIFGLVNNFEKCLGLLLSWLGIFLKPKALLMIFGLIYYSFDYLKDKIKGNEIIIMEKFKIYFNEHKFCSELNTESDFIKKNHDLFIDLLFKIQIWLRINNIL